MFAKELLETFLLPVLERLAKFTQGNEMTRYAVHILSVTVCVCVCDCLSVTVCLCLSDWLPASLF